MIAQLKLDYETRTDLDLAADIAARDPIAVRLVTGRNNQRLFRTAWSILKDHDEAEDAVQSTYLKAFAAIGGFAGKSSLSRSEEHTSELQSLMRISYAVFCLKKKTHIH